MRALYICLYFECMSDLMTLRIIWGLETRIGSLITFVRVSVLWEKDCLDSLGGRINIFRRKLIKTFGGSPRVDDQHKLRRSCWRLLVIQLQGSCNNKKGVFYCLSQLYLYLTLFEKLQLFSFSGRGPVE